jgi:hypothetical protein
VNAAPRGARHNPGMNIRRSPLTECEIAARASHFSLICQNAGTPIADDLARAFGQTSGCDDAGVLQAAREAHEKTKRPALALSAHPAPAAPAPSPSVPSFDTIVGEMNTVLRVFGFEASRSEVAKLLAAGYTPDTLTAKLADERRAALASPEGTLDAFRRVLRAGGFDGSADEVADAVSKGHTPETLAAAFARAA